MIKLNDMELAEAKRNPDVVAQLLVRKAIEEEMLLKPFTEEEAKSLETVRKNVEIEFFLNLRAEGNVKVTDLDILELYKNNIAVLKDKKVEEIFPQLKQAVFNQKLGAEKAMLVNELVKKYDLNALLKEYLPELDIQTDAPADKIQAVPSPEEAAEDKRTEAPVEMEAGLQPVPDLAETPEPVAETVFEELPQDPGFQDKLLFDQAFSAPVSSVVPEKPYVEPLPSEDGPFGEPFDSGKNLEDLFNEGPPHIAESVAFSEEPKDLFDTPKVVFDDSILKAPGTRPASQVSAGEEQKNMEEPVDDDGDSPNMPFSFGNFNFKFD
ncbi:MAG: hypothetical protein LBQ96_07195 [Fusobacteriaceae bacterium]|jgi:hypothetical protein|nr:hypothetical protein [Fusobacteriaceae bacterium]